MAAFDFPSNPSNGQSYTANNVTYVWNGSAWKKSDTNALTINSNADNRIITGSGTNNTLNGESNFTWDGSAANITGRLTVSAQPCVQLHTISNVSTFGTSTEATPLQFSGVHINQGGMILSNSNSRVEVPVSGIYLVNGMASGGNYTTTDAGDGVRLQVMRNGTSYPDVKAYGMNTLGSTNNQEFFWSFSIFLDLTATDYIELEFENISTNFGGAITRGAFGAHLLS